MDVTLIPALLSVLPLVAKTLNEYPFIALLIAGTAVLIFRRR